MLPKANLQLVYVSDINRSTAFYREIFDAEPEFISPRYVAFSTDSKKDALFAIWTGSDKPDLEVPRYSEIGIMLSSDEEVNNLYEEWRTNKHITIMREPYDEVFGRTFLIKDPDGHVIRVCKRD